MANLGKEQNKVATKGSARYPVKFVVMETYCRKCRRAPRKRWQSCHITKRLSGRYLFTDKLPESCHRKHSVTIQLFDDDTQMSYTPRSHIRWQTEMLTSLSIVSLNFP